MQYTDPRLTGSGVTRHSQLNPNMTSAFSQQQRPQATPAVPPMVSALQRAPQQPAPAPPTGSLKPAVGTFGPKSGVFSGLKRRAQTDFGKGGWQGGFNATGSLLNVKSPFGAALGIQRRAKGSGNDLSVNDATTAIQRQYQQSLGRAASPEDIQSQLAGQGLKPGDRWVGNKGLEAVLGSITGSEEARNYQAPPNVNTPPTEDIAGGFQTLESPLQSALQAPNMLGGAKSAYQEYLGEFGEGDPEQPLDFETFATYYDQLPQNDAESPLASAVSGRRGWENLLLDTQGAHDSPMSFSGFNMERAMAGGDPNSVKDAVARALSTFDIDLRGKTKEETGQILASPQFHEMLQAQGVQSRPIPGAYDQIEVFTKENGWETRDIVANAGSADAQWWWGDVGGMDAPADDYGLDAEFPTGDEEAVQSPLLSGLTGGSNWKTLLDQLLSQYSQG